MDSKNQRFTVETLASLVFAAMLTTCGGMALPPTTLSPPTQPLSRPCPPCETILELTEDQIHQAEVGMQRFIEVEDPLDPVPQVQFSPVTLNQEQIDFIESKFGMLFSSDPPSAAVSTPAPSRERRDEGNQPEKGPRVCEVDTTKYQSLELTYDLNNKTVQVIQLPQGSQRIITEECKDDFPLINPHDNLLCDEEKRQLPALVINLEEPTLGIRFENIQVQTCVSYFKE